MPPARPPPPRRCIHEADKRLMVDMSSAVEKGFPPAWDPVTRWKFTEMYKVFQRNMDLDAVMLDLSVEYAKAVPSGATVPLSSSTAQ
jgi:hypothetical protein